MIREDKNTVAPKQRLSKTSHLGIQVGHQQARSPRWSLGLEGQLLVLLAVTAVVSLPAEAGGRQNVASTARS